MQATKLKIFSGRKIPYQTLSRVKKIWREVFKKHNPLWKKDKELLSGDTFFVVYNNKKIVSTGRLRKVTIRFQNKKYSIQGIADIASLVKNKGYGTILMKAMRNYLKKNNQVGIGFCSQEVTPFYLKCGFEVTNQLTKRFIYKNKDKKAIKNKGNVLYFDLKNKLINQIIQNQQEKVYLNILHW